MDNCKTCKYSLFDPVWGEYKCAKKHRTCTAHEKENGCDKLVKIKTVLADAK